MQYLLLLHLDDTAWSRMSKTEQEQGMAAYTAYTQALRSADVLVAADRLMPAASATCVRVVAGKSQVLDGPYSESKEQVAGDYQIRAKDLDAALAWAARCPAASHGTVEVRAISAD